uniref:ABC-2 type transporter n=1 Tax=Hildenbrandia rivularis TaxID=135206 RepID=A0A1C9CFR8_9FLOR|nr:ABC-2 type transporter [Hildenbrandia rivularis]AOM67214.1 ABC-2 type transporter [Hildenbrandia rivularis]
MTVFSMSPQYKNILSPRQHILETISNLQFMIQELQALNFRLLLQIWRQPSPLIAGLLQPLLWLILFGALFQNAPVSLFSSNTKYGQFLSAGIIVFTAFTGSLNAGLSLMFDREFGFLNRLIVAPLVSKESIIFSSTIFISIISIGQVILIICASIFLGHKVLNSQGLLLIAFIILLITLGVTMFSLNLAFILPGHIELLAFILITNLPFLFSSTALAPLSFMPLWMQILASLNPLSYAIETVRFIYENNIYTLESSIIETIWGTLTLQEIIALFILIDILGILIIKKFVLSKLKY